MFNVNKSLIQQSKTQNYVGIRKNYFTQGELQQGTVCQGTEKVHQLGGERSDK